MLLDVLTVLEPQLDAVVLVRAQAVYLRHGRTDLGVSALQSAKRLCGLAPRSPTSLHLGSAVPPVPGRWSRCVVSRHPPEVTVLEPIAVALQADDLGVVDQAVDHGGGNGGVPEHLAPAPEGPIGGDQHRGPLVAGRHQLEEQVGRLGLEGDVAHFVDDEEGVAPEAAELVVEAPGSMYQGQAAPAPPSSSCLGPCTGLRSTNGLGALRMQSPGAEGRTDQPAMAVR